MTKDTKNLVIARLKVIPDNLKLSIGGGEYTKDELIKHVEQGDEIGKKIIEIEMSYLRSLKEGVLYEK